MRNTDRIILKKYEPSCVFCQNVDNVIDFHGRNVCPECIKALGEKLG